ncbi:NAD-P-binding protein [Schizophyllum amplum]|uniref:NAD-P-binding protein n=1 Tax=Schizophyllum amplum TaxID=97359 RepID=A0A550CIL4_9AGAR|nr:NAD-P-binding protein [Auriculariopsis ampla]
MALNGITSLIRSFFDQSMMSQFFPPKSQFEPSRDIPDLTGQVALVTGGNGGAGYETCKHLLAKGAKVYMACRSAERGKAAADKLQKETGHAPEILELDLADLASVRRAAEEFMRRETVLHTLYNNAGAVWVPIDMLTAQGYDLAFGTNVLGHFFFTTLLMPILRHTHEVTGRRPRVINTSSSAHVPSHGQSGIVWESLRDGPDRQKVAPSIGSYCLYSQSKMGVIMLSYLFDQHFGNDIVSIALNPGNFSSDAYRYVHGVQKLSTSYILYSVPEGALTQLWAGTAPESEFKGGEYCIPWARHGQCDPRARNSVTQDALWGWLQEQVKGF